MPRLTSDRDQIVDYTLRQWIKNKTDHDREPNS